MLFSERTRQVFELLQVFAGHSATQVLSVDLFFVADKSTQLKLSKHVLAGHSDIQVLSVLSKFVVDSWVQVLELLQVPSGQVATHSPVVANLLSVDMSMHTLSL